MKLYYAVPSSCSRRILILLALKGATCEGVRVSLLGEQDVARHRKAHPMGQVPVLEVESADGPVFIAQSQAIAEYLEERFPDPQLLGRDAIERARIREVTNLVTAGIQPLHNMRTLQFLAELAGGDSVQVWTQRFVKRGLDTLEAIANRHAGPFTLGANVTLADVFVSAQLDFVRLREVLDLADYPALQRVESACLELEAFANPPLP